MTTNPALVTGRYYRVLLTDTDRAGLDVLRIRLGERSWADVLRGMIARELLRAQLTDSLAQMKED